MRRAIATCTVLALASCGAEGPSPQTNDIGPSLLPSPHYLAVMAGTYDLHDGFRIVAPNDPDIIAAVEWISGLIDEQTDLSLSVTTDADDDAAIRLRLVDGESLRAEFAAVDADRKSERPGAEAYSLNVSADGIDINATTAAGLFYGMVTLWQLLEDAGHGAAVLPLLTIVDRPAFKWRGLMLDSARHMQSAAFIMRYIDWMALHKLNVLHWHLTDDQAWRLEIRKYPRLTGIGAWRKPAGDAPAAELDPATGNPRLYGGFYTQATVRDIVAHARSRHVEIVPEINVPGHATAAIVAYPELGTAPSRIATVPGSWGVFDNVLNLEESTFRFLEDVLGEVVGLFPGEFIHLGGDEVVSTQWRESRRVRERMRELDIPDFQALQNYYVERLQAFLARYGRRVIGWDEILQGDLPADTAIMSWRGADGAIDAAAKGHQTVLSPAPTLYLDHLQTADADAPPGRGGVITVRDVYEFDPLPDSLRHRRAQILGLQGNLWTEHVRTEAYAAYMSYPRAVAIAELGWTDAEHRDWNDFIRRLADHTRRMGLLGIEASDAAFAVSIRVAPELRVSLSNQSDFGIIRYTTDGSDPDARSEIYREAFTPIPPLELRAASFHAGRRISEVRSRMIDVSSSIRREDRELELCQESLVLALEDDAPLRGERESYLVDIMNPCWILPHVRLDASMSVSAAVGQLPFNFEIGAAIDDVVVRPARTASGEFIATLDRCDGPVLAELSLAPAIGRPEATTLPGVPLILPTTAPEYGDICFTFRRHGIEPIWVIDWVEITKEPVGDRR